MEESELAIINNVYDYSNVIPTLEGIFQLVLYCSEVYKQFLKLTEDDEKRNEQFKAEYRRYNYKNSYGTKFEIYISKYRYHDICCKDLASFQSAIENGNLMNIERFEIEMKLDFKRGEGLDLIEHENSYRIIYRPYEITFTRKSNYSEQYMNQVENDINSIFNKLPVVNTVFCAK